MGPLALVGGAKKMFGIISFDGALPFLCYSEKFQFISNKDILGENKGEAFKAQNLFFSSLMVQNEYYNNSPPSK